jgi:peroxiredoxin
MPLVEAKPVIFGKPAIPFALCEPLTGNTISLINRAGPQGVLVAFLSPNCSLSSRIIQELDRFARDYEIAGISVIAINPDTDDLAGRRSAASTAEYAQAHHLSFPYLWDEDQTVALAYEALCTPELFLFDAEHLLYYHGRFEGDGSDGDRSSRGNELRAAAEDLLRDALPPSGQVPQLGNAIVWPGIAGSYRSEAAE